MTTKFFWKSECSKCPAAKESISDLKDVEFYNLDEAEGLAEAAFYSVMSTPSLVISDDKGAELASFRGEMPTAEELGRWR